MPYPYRRRRETHARHQLTYQGIYGAIPMQEVSPSVSIGSFQQTDHLRMVHQTASGCIVSLWIQNRFDLASKQMLGAAPWFGCSVLLFLASNGIAREGGSISSLRKTLFENPPLFCLPLLVQASFCPPLPVKQFVSAVRAHRDSQGGGGAAGARAQRHLRAAQQQRSARLVPQRRAARNLIHNQSEHLVGRVCFLFLRVPTQSKHLIGAKCGWFIITPSVVCLCVGVMAYDEGSFCESKGTVKVQPTQRCLNHISPANM